MCVCVCVRVGGGGGVIVRVVRVCIRRNVFYSVFMHIYIITTTDDEKKSRVIFAEAIKPSGRLGTKIRNCTTLDRIRVFKMSLS